MLKFEIKKSFKKKIFLTILIYAFVIASLTGIFYNSNYPQLISEVKPENYAYASLFSYVDFLSEENSHLSENDIEDLIHKAERLELKERLFQESLLSKHNELLDYDDLINLNQIYYDSYQEMSKIIDDYKLNLLPEREDDFSWDLFASQYRNETGTFLSMPGLTKDTESQVEQLIVAQDFLLGVPFLLIFIFLFAGEISGEKEDTSINLIKTQGVSKFKYVFSKFLLLIFYALIYYILVNIFYILIMHLFGVPYYNGHLKLYRIFDGQPISYLMGYQVLMVNFIAYILYFSFIGSFLLLISSFTNSKNSSISIVFFIIAVLYGLTLNFSVLDKSYNPVNFYNYHQNILGKVDYDIFYKANGLRPYVILFSLSFFFIGLSLLDFNIPSLEISKSHKNKSRLDIFRFEKIKIVNGPSFKFFIISGLVFLVFVFMAFKVEDDQIVNYKYYNYLIIEDYDKEIDRIEKDIEIHKSKKNTLNEDYDQSMYDSYLEFQLQAVDSIKKLKENTLLEQNYFKNNIGSEFYKLKYDFYNKNAESFDLSGFSDEPSLPSRRENQAIYEYLIENNIDSIEHRWPYMVSKYAEVDNSILAQESRTLTLASSHSPLYSIYRLFISYNLDIIFIFFFILVILVSYSPDKENGSQIELMYTQPTKRPRYHIYKLGASFFIGMLCLLAIFAFYIILGLIFEGRITADYPIIFYTELIRNPLELAKADYFTIIPIWKYLINLFMIIVFQLIFVSSLGNLISIFVKRRVNLLVYTSLILVAGIIISNYLPDILRLISPFSHLKALDIADGSIRITKSFDIYKIWMSFIILLSNSLILLLLGGYLTGKREIK